MLRLRTNLEYELGAVSTYRHLIPREDYPDATT
jgi:hypothetical protein